MKLDDISKYMEEAGIPGRDAYELPSSDKRFPDGASYRIELSLGHSVKVLEAVIKERRKRNVPVHRFISLNQGGTLYDKQELRDYAQMAAEDKIEVIAFPGPRTAWDIGRQFLTEEGKTCGVDHRGSDEVRKVIADMMRMYDAGIRGFLIIDRGLIWLLKKMQDQGNFPKDVALKVSVLAGISSAVGAKIIEEQGATSFNPAGDLTLPQLASIRKAVSIPIDVYMCAFGSFGKPIRFYDAPEVARLCSPCYFKFELAPSSKDFNAPWTSEQVFIDLLRNHVKWAENVIDIVRENRPDIEVSKQGPDDMCIPKV